ncbi:MAG: flavodoxin-dependent (E)-4-hydroxy-3-methylbut-2-enyl-diphosphate synthase [Ruminococcaceae bacterium]|nr:flavodoxin-dependent (E)-4-hydroxy-3-methylbut-2-enyl-diphosphate synthase [Oscillospiraceae bacterium]
MKVNAGTVSIGGGSPISVQTMTTTNTNDTEKTIAQVKLLAEAGADIVRLAVPDMAAAESFARIKKAVSVPLVADIHFDYRIALACIEGGADKIRLNPGNIGSPERVRQVAAAAKSAKIPIRIGVNGGSLEKEMYEKYGNTPLAMVESAKYHASLLEKEGFSDIVISLKASNVQKTVEAYRLMAKSGTYPLHIGVTEAGTAYTGLIKSAAGIGSLLLDGIGDTIRVSLSAPPEEEVRAGITLLRALGKRQGAELISCPTCGRCKIDLMPIAREMEAYLATVNVPIRVAVMGCAVNGPGEAREAHVGVAGGDGKAVLFRQGEIVESIPADKIIPVLRSEIERIIKAWK